MKKAIVCMAVLILVLFGDGLLWAQCPMCKMAAESNLNSGGQVAKGLNTGILYLLAMPYLAVLILGIAWYRNKKKLQQA
ncbi:MAG TPA: hypothetical protein VFX48_06795 [Saprospiraceae bacterium]|nr:hypothetical protein [Saprospiraceae bacterium]